MCQSAVNLVLATTLLQHFFPECSESSVIFLSNLFMIHFGLKSEAGAWRSDIWKLLWISVALEAAALLPFLSLALQYKSALFPPIPPHIYWHLQTQSRGYNVVNQMAKRGVKRLISEPAWGHKSETPCNYFYFSIGSEISALEVFSCSPPLLLSYSTSNISSSNQHPSNPDSMSV